MTFDFVHRWCDQEHKLCCILIVDGGCCGFEFYPGDLNTPSPHVVCDIFFGDLLRLLDRPDYVKAKQEAWVCMELLRRKTVGLHIPFRPTGISKHWAEEQQ